MLRNTRYFGPVQLSDWNNWSWQEKNSIRSAKQIHALFPKFPDDRLEVIERYCQSFRLKVTPYAMELVEPDENGIPKEDDPFWSQFFPPRAFINQDQGIRADAFGIAENWEPGEDMVTPIGQHKYTNRICLRMSANGACLGLCPFCFEALRVTDKRSLKKGPGKNIWQETISYIARTPAIEEVVLSGGEPLIYNNEQLDQYLHDIRSIPHVRFIRIHTRALTFTPMRIDEVLVKILLRYCVQAVHVHVCHSRECQTPEFKEAINRLRFEAKILHLRAHIPLLKGVNDKVDSLKNLFFNLYELGIDPYYLLHSFPQAPTVHYHRMSVRKGVELLLQLKRHVTNPLIPEYVICHPTGKQTVPLTLESSPFFEYATREDGWPVIRYTNWKGQRVEYLDCPE